MTKKNYGFTLIELMIVVAVIGIISALAYPSYTSFVARGKRADVKRVMLDLAQWEERYFTNNNTYITTASAIATSPALSGFLTQSPTSGAPSFNVTVTANTGGSIATGYLITATTASGYTDANCPTMTLDFQGNKTPASTGSNTTSCW